MGLVVLNYHDEGLPGLALYPPLIRFDIQLNFSP